MIVYPAVGHLGERHLQHVVRPLRPGLAAHTQQEVELWLLGKLGGAAEPVDRVEERGEGLVCPGQLLGSRLVLPSVVCVAEIASVSRGRSPSISSRLLSHTSETARMTVRNEGIPCRSVLGK